MKKLLTFLGTTNYVYVNYILDDEKVESVRFVQQALAKILCKGWTEEDKIVVFLTKEAREKNWEDGFYKDDRGEPLRGLKTELYNLNLKVKIEEVDIPEGKNENELWELFKKILDEINENDEIYFDITHSFRSLPLLVMIALNYGVNIKNAKIKGIFYGAVEALGPPQEIKEMDKKKRNAPIFDLTPFVTLFDWTIATRRFIDTGDASLLQKLTQEKLKPLLAQTKGKEGKGLKNFVNLLKQLSDSFATCRQKELPNIIHRLRENIEEAKKDISTIPTFQPLIGIIEEKLNKLKFGSFEEVLTVTEWCLNHNLIQQGFTLLREGIITYYVEKLGRNDTNNRETREAIVDALNCIGRNIKETETLKKFPEKEKLCKSISRKVAETFVQILEYRNDINHAGWVDNYHKAEAFKDKLKEFVKKLKEEVQDD